MNTFYARGVCGPVTSISQIAALRDFPQIINHIVQLVSVDVVNLVLWPIAMVVEPDEPVRKERFTLDSYLEIATTINASGYISSMDSSPALSP
ncbi:MAG: hypothetical protein WC047_00460 [Kiritimatiellales bacterium]